MPPMLLPLSKMRFVSTRSQRVSLLCVVGGEPLVPGCGLRVLWSAWYSRRSCRRSRRRHHVIAKGLAAEEGGEGFEARARLVT